MTRKVPRPREHQLPALTPELVLDALKRLRLEKGVPVASETDWPHKGSLWDNPDWRRYVASSAPRFARTLRWLSGLVGPEARVLELGCSPFAFTYLLHRAFRCKIAGVSFEPRRLDVWPGSEHETSASEVALDDGEERLAIPLWTVNVERQPLPFADSSFDLVLCHEILEHLLHDPSFMLREANRVLSEGGLLSITTPNALRLSHFAFHLLNRNPADKYSRSGPYLRHNREYALAEVKGLLEACNFRVVRGELVNHVQEQLAAGRALTFAVRAAKLATTDLPLPYLKNKRDHIFVLAEPCGPPEAGKPAWLFSSPDDEILG
jgi:SAM-dependent methyltransferase